MKNTDRSIPCAYCGTSQATTKDHVVPRCLFRLPYPPNLVTVPSCAECNRIKGKDDEFLRDYLTSDVAVQTSPYASKIFDGKVKRAVKRNSSELAKLVQQGPIRTIPVKTKAGIYTGGTVITVPLPDDRIATTLFQMCRGLYFHSQKRALANDIRYEALRHPPKVGEEIPEKAMKNSAGKTLGDVFDCRFMHLGEDHPSVTFWLLSFYGRIVFSISTGNLPEDLDIP